MRFMNFDNEIYIKEVKESEDSQPSIFDNPAFQFLVDQGVYLIVILLLTYWLKSVKPRVEDLNKTIDVNRRLKPKIDNILSQLCGILDADRVLLGRFHNGGHWIDGIPWLKMTAYNEILRNEGIGSIKNQVKNISVEDLIMELRSLENYSYLELKRSSKDIDEKCVRHLDDIGIGAITEFLVTDKKDQPLGIISVQYLSENTQKKLDSIDEDQHQRVFQLVSQVAYEIEKAREEAQENAVKRVSKKLLGIQ